MKHQTRQSDNVKLQYFNSPEILSEYLSETPDDSSCMGTTHGVSKSRTMFTGTESFQQADDYMKSVKIWEEGREKFLKSKLVVDSVYGTQVEQSYYHDVAGSVVDMGRYLDGEPECMIEFTQTEVELRGKILDIYFDLVVSGGMSTNAMTNYGIGVYSIVDALEQEGYRVNLYVCGTWEFQDRKEVVTIKIKTSEQHLEMNQMLYCIAHPSFCRRHLFSWYDKQPKNKYGRGQPQELKLFKKNQLMWFYNENQKHSYFLRNIQNMPSHINTAEKIRDYHLESIKRQMQDTDDGTDVALSDGELHFQFR
jgi:hypothetical protein